MMIESDYDVLDLWRICDELSVVDAALLFAGESPSSKASLNVDDDKWGHTTDFNMAGYLAANSA